MTRKRNPTIVTGRVGAKSRPRKPRISHRTPRVRIVADGGPLDNQVLSLTTDRRTLPIVVRGQAGWYAGGKWQPSHVST